LFAQLSRVEEVRNLNDTVENKVGKCIKIVKLSWSGVSVLSGLHELAKQPMDASSELQKGIKNVKILLIVQFLPPSKTLGFLEIPRQ
jgi:hypothetical protein